MSNAKPYASLPTKTPYGDRYYVYPRSGGETTCEVCEVPIKVGDYCFYPTDDAHCESCAKELRVLIPWTDESELKNPGAES